MVGYGSHDQPAGCWSDDTSMTLAALDSLAFGTVDYDAIMRNFAKWFFEDEYTPCGVVFDIGGTCIQAIMNYTRYHKKPLECGDTQEGSNGNGSLMRILPFVLYEAVREETFELDFIHDASALTHAHQRSMIGCGIYSIILLYLLWRPCRDSIREGLAEAQQAYREFPEAKHYNRLFGTDFEHLSREEIRSSGYVVDTLEAAVWCALTTESYAECVLKAVNLGRDTDTVAAVAGGLAGALYGLEGIPEEWLAELKRRGWIEEMCERAAANWTRVQK